MLDPHTLIGGLLLLLGFFLLWSIPTFVGPAPPSRRLDRLSVIIPARNEESRLTPLLRSLHAQTEAPGEILVVDDGSTDGTADVGRRMGASVMEADPLPAGWTGKNWACHQGAATATGDLLLFLDADTRLEPDGLLRLMTAFEATGGLLSVQPYHVVRHPYEELSAFFNIIVMAGSNAFTPLGRSWPAHGAFGPCILCSRRDYLRTGGHATVRGAVLESIPLAASFASHGLPIQCRGGRGAITFRMYPTGFRDLLTGWTKSFGTGAAAIAPIATILVAAWVTGCFSAFVSCFRTWGDPSWWLATLVYVLAVVQVRWMLVRIGAFRWWTAPLFPIPLTFFALVMLRSLIMTHILRRVSWRGRTVRTSQEGEAGWE